MKKIILHHSYTPQQNKSSFEAIRNYHVNVLGWNDIGYHELIEEINGVVSHKDGRDRHTMGSHVKGQNEGTIGICLVGNFDKAPPSQEMMDYLYERLNFYRVLYGSIQIEGHCDWATKSCPGKQFPLDEVKARYRTDGKHWGDKPHSHLQEFLEDTLEKRYDDKMTRAEQFSLQSRIIKKMEEKINEIYKRL